MPLTLITAPTIEPVTLAEAKLAARVDGSEFDALIPLLITTAREMAEHQTGRAFITQTWERTLDAFPAAEIELGRPNVLDITSLKYVGAAGVQQTLAGDQYELDAETLPGFALPAYGVAWPSTLDMANAVRVRFTAGYGATAADVPEGIKTWIKLHVSLWIRQAEAASDRPYTAMPFVDFILSPYRTWCS